MRRSLQVLAVCAALLLAVRLMAQDTGGGGMDTSGGSGSSDTSGGSTGSDNSGGNNSGGENNNGNNGGAMGGAGSPAGSTGDQGQGGTGAAAPGTGEQPPSGGTEGQGQGSSIAPTAPTALPPGVAAPVPGTTPAPTPAGLNGVSGATQGAVQTAPVTFTLPSGYGNASSQSFTLGEGRLSKPPITFTATISQGLDSNIFNADSNIQRTTPVAAPTPPLEARFTGIFRINPPSPPTPIFQIFRPKALPTPTPIVPVGVISSPVSAISLGIQVQQGSPRTLLTMDLALGEQDYWNQPGNTMDYTGNFDLTLVHRLSPRATVSLEAFAVYQNTPDFALINAPTNNGNSGNYLNGSFKGDLSYAWSSRVSTVTSAAVNFNLLQTSASSNLYQITYGTQFRYSVSARNSLTAEVRDSSTVYPTDSTANNTSLFYLLGLDTFFSAKLRNTIDGGLEVQSYAAGAASQTIPYMETATTLVLPRQASLSWTNRFGSEETGNASQTATSYRTGLTLSEPISTKMSSSVSLAYNYVSTKDPANPAGDTTQTQVQASFSLGYNLSPRLSLSLSYTYLDLLTKTINSSYNRQQIYLGGTYTFR